VNLAPIVKMVRAYDATEWEIFISEWQKGLQGYHAVKRLGGAGDHGRDVIGLCSPDACQGVWDNYQCKHYEGPLSAPRACEDAGKIIFHAFRGEFEPPRRCSFVAPRGPTTELRDFLLNPDKFKAEITATWNTRVAGRVREADRELTEADEDQEELLRIDSELDDELNRSFVVQETAEISYRELTSNRLDLRREYEGLQDRLGEIDTLQARFALLIILENVDVPDWLVGQPQVLHFTGSDSVGRAGLFPSKHNLL
jgi:hypothetical protein